MQADEWGEARRRDREIARAGASQSFQLFRTNTTSWF